MFLATTGLTELWDTKDRILALGPWCTRNDNRAQWEGLQLQYAANPWDDRERLHAAALYCEDLAEVVLAHLASKLNRIHGTSWSNRYWRILIGHWLIRFVHAFYDRYVHVTDALASHPGVHSSCLSAENYVSPRDTADFANLYTKDFFNLQLYSQILQSIPNPPKLTVRKFNPHFESPAAARSTSKRGMAKLFEKIVHRPSAKTMLSEPGLEWSSVYELARRLNFDLTLLLEDDSARERKWKTDYDLRKELKGTGDGSEFLEILLQSLPYNLPKSFLEGYAELRQRALRRFQQLPRVVFSATGWFFNEAFKFVAAEASEGGAKLIAWQHGGGYYLWRHGPQPMEIKTADHWLSWGHAPWLQGVDALANPRFFELDKNDYWSHPTPKAGILVAGNEHSMYPYWLLSIPLGFQYAEYIKWRIQFVQSLDTNLRKDTLMRLYPEDYGWAQAEQMRKNLPGVRLDDHSATFLDRLKQVRLAVFDHPTTSFIEAIAFNIPTLLFWNPKHWESHEGARACMTALREAGILHENPETAAAQAGRVYDDPKAWWKSAAVQEARRHFMNTFAYVNPKWLDEWQSVIQRSL